jgi:SAM-dependent methyltransferase
VTGASGPESFSLTWLRQREPHDAAARDRALARRFAAALPAAPRLLDLGCGDGANLRYLAPLLPPGQRWLALDADAALLAAAGRAAPPGAAVATRQLDLARHLGALDLGAFDGVTAAALLDLVSRDWLERLVGCLAAARLPFLAALSVDGRIAWQPADAADALVAAAFACDQGRDKGFGPALGAAAPSLLAGLLAAIGYRVAVAASDWHLAGAAAGLLPPVIDLMANAAMAAAPHQAAAVADWAARRRDEAAAGALALTLGHQDVLGLP